MAGFDHKAFADEYRRRRGPLPQALYDDLIACVDVGLGLRPAGAPVEPVATAPSRANEPTWLLEARKHIGQSEIPGPRHSGFVTGLWKALGQPIADDETPWCGGFVGYVLKSCGIQPVASPAWARNWAKFGKACDRALGAIAVFGRPGGGGHVAFLVGVSRDGKKLYVLGGNQSNQVNIMPIDASRLIALRWPSAYPVGAVAPFREGGVVSTNEA